MSLGSRLGGLVVVLALAVSLSSCADAGTDTNDSAQPTSQAQPQKTRLVLNIEAARLGYVNPVVYRVAETDAGEDPLISQPFQDTPTHVVRQMSKKGYVPAGPTSFADYAATYWDGKTTTYSFFEGNWMVLRNRGGMRVLEVADVNAVSLVDKPSVWVQPWHNQMPPDSTVPAPPAGAPTNYDPFVNRLT